MKNIQKKILVVGLGKTGSALTSFIIKREGKVVGVDDLSHEKISPAFKQYSPDVFQFFSSKEIDDIPWETIDEVIVSPGIALNHPVLEKCYSLKLKVSGELEWASPYNSSPIIAVTGTNGKSTTTELIGAFLRDAGFKIALGGNLGTPWIELIDQVSSPDWTVLEVSSFQLETIQSFHPKISLLLNLTEDHLDRHPTMQLYGEAKGKIFKNQKKEDFLIYNANDHQILKIISTAQATLVPFSSTQSVKGIFWKSEAALSSSIRKDFSKNFSSPIEYSLQTVPLKGLHNIENMMAAIAVAELVGIQSDQIQNSLKQFKALPHRLEWVRKLNGVDYYDDSKGTNVGAVAMSLASFDNPVVLILGGKDKGGDYGILKGLIRHKTRAVIVLGEAKRKIVSALKNSGNLIEVNSLQEAVRESQKISQAGDVVLLSPACSSFDMFRDYKHRGDEFQRFVREL